MNIGNDSGSNSGINSGTIRVEDDMTTAREWPNNMIEVRDTSAELIQSALVKLDQASYKGSIDPLSLEKVRYDLSESLRWLQYAGAR